MDSFKSEKLKNTMQKSTILLMMLIASFSSMAFGDPVEVKQEKSISTNEHFNFTVYNLESEMNMRQKLNPGFLQNTIGPHIKNMDINAMDFKYAGIKQGYHIFYNEATGYVMATSKINDAIIIFGQLSNL